MFLLHYTLTNILLKFEIQRRGLEELTTDIPNVSEEATANLDENGLIRSWLQMLKGEIF